MSIEAMKQALNALKQIDDAMPFPVAKHAMMQLRQAIKQAEKSDPVATMWQHGETGRTRITTPDSITDCDARWFKVSDLYTAPSRRRKPLTVEELIPLAVVLFVIDEKDLDGMYVSNLSQLQDELRQKLVSAMCERNSRLVKFARAIEAAHGIKE